MERMRRAHGTMFRLFLLITPFLGTSFGISVTCPTKNYVAILFQPVVLKCNYQTTSSIPPTVTWRYKSFCENPVTAALSPNSASNQIAQVNPNYNPVIDCPDSSRTIRIVASKQGSSVTLGNFYQGRQITIVNDADLSMDRTAWGEGGVYHCSVISSQDLTGTSEDYVQLIVLDWLLVVLIIMGVLLFMLLIGICWCQCCPHTCCCYVRCPCCPEKCCCPRALYEAGKAATSGVPSVYAPSMYAPSVYSHPSQVKLMPQGASIPMMPIAPGYNGYMPEYDGASSGMFFP
ncbi:lipolysis-stimulated lipoprotein receptor-like isoform X2 [Polypterus senegalus]|uniref:lipolysis-stimulated lipoprotein receptor-like isoform X2 n=1 Tax=Polypterus senegalus TaxID=55291 RepID=UPI0019655DA0|nr:lipolysis-stimulated lipoprotein receptor-like isoform X2 [Polypterus senegalus]